jgi:hypothetical protein
MELFDPYDVLTVNLKTSLEHRIRTFKKVSALLGRK